MKSPLLWTGLLAMTVLLSFHTSVAQVDSLMGVFNDPEQSDSMRAEAMFMAASAVSRTNPDSAMQMRKALLEFGRQRNCAPCKALAYRGMGYSFYKSRQMDSAEHYYMRSIELAEQSNMWVTSAKVNYNMIWIYHNTGEKTKGRDAALRAAAAAEKAEMWKMQADAFQQLGGIYETLGEGTKALQALQDAQVIAERIQDSASLSFVLGTLGLVHYKQGETEKALEYTLQSIAILERIGLEGQLAAGLGNLAMIYDYLDRFDEAMETNQRALAIFRKLGNTQSIAITLMNMGINDAQQSKPGFGLSQIEEAYHLLEDGGDAWPYNASMKMMGMAYAYQGDHRQSAKWCLKALEHSREVELLPLQLDNLKCVYEAYESQGKYKEALNYYRHYKIAEDSLFSEDRAKEFARQETQFAYEKKILADSIQNASEQQLKDARIATQEAQIESEQTQRFTLYGGVALLLLFGGFMYNRFRVTARQKAIIEAQKKEVEDAHEQLEEKNTEILDSINYAKRIQTAILPPDRIVKEYLETSFILYKPKDIVAGDFYWLEAVDDWVFFAAADCTGHGVPGAMVSVICNNGLNRSVREFGLREPAGILDKTRELVIREFEKSDEEVKDGMDISLCALNSKTHELKWAGANNPLWIVRASRASALGVGSENDDKGTEVLEGPVLEEIKADKQPIGQYALAKPFTNHSIQLNEGDSLYIFSDGFPDQFGGENGKKYKSGKFKKTLMSMAQKPIREQKQLLDREFETWRGHHEQIDDVCVIGVKI